MTMQSGQEYSKNKQKIMSKNELGLDVKPARPLDRSALANDEAALRSLVGMLNNPAITGAEVPKPGAASPAVTEGPGGETLVTESLPASDPITRPAAVPVAAVAVPPAAPAIGLRLFFTGSLASRCAREIGAAEFSVALPVVKLASFFFGESLFPADGTVKGILGADNFIATIKAWGSGEISNNFPITPARAIFITLIKSLARGKTKVLPEGPDWLKFGTGEGFWIDSCVNMAAEFHNNNPYRRIAITGVTTQIELNYFKALGLTHWHVMSAPGTGLAGDNISVLLDNSCTKTVSNQKTGPKLRAVWCGAGAPISNRIWTMAEFMAACATAPEAPALSME
jgi:hypothetical protein